MKVDRVDQSNQTLECSVTVGEFINNKGVNFPDVQLSVRLTEKDRVDLPLTPARR